MEPKKSISLKNFAKCSLLICTLLVQNAITPSFQTIIEPLGPLPEPNNQEQVKVEVFNTFGCRTCDIFGQGILPQLVEKYSNNGRVNLHLYLVPDRESEAELYATRGAHCASKYERFWDLVFKMHESEELGKRAVDVLGQELNLPILGFRECISSDTFDEQIGLDIAYGEARGASPHPIIFVNDTVLLGSQPIENIERIISKYLNQ